MYFSQDFIALRVDRIWYSGVSASIRSLKHMIGNVFILLIASFSVIYTGLVVYAAAEAAFLYLVEEKGYAPESITLYGRSLGSGPSCWLAEGYPVAGLILDSAFSSTFRVLTGRKLLPFDKFDNLAILADLDFIQK